MDAYLIGSLGALLGSLAGYLLGSRSRARVWRSGARSGLARARASRAGDLALAREAGRLELWRQVSADPRWSAPSPLGPAGGRVVRQTDERLAALDRDGGGSEEPDPIPSYPGA